jgi:hypothetical protein
MHQWLRDVHKADNITPSVRTDQKLQYRLLVLRSFLIEMTWTIYVHILILLKFQHAIDIFGLSSMPLARTFGASRETCRDSGSDNQVTMQFISIQFVQFYHKDCYQIHRRSAAGHILGSQSNEVPSKFEKRKPE